MTYYDDDDNDGDGDDGNDDDDDDDDDLNSSIPKCSVYWAVCNWM